MYHGPAENGHVIRESMRQIALRNLEKKRPRQYAGIGRGPDRPTLRRTVETFKTDKELSLVRQILAEAIWTGERANKWGLAQDAPCSHCGEGPEDEEHIFWVCKRWEETRDAWKPKVEELAAAVPGLGGPCRQEWPICTMMIAMVPMTPGVQDTPEKAAAV